MAKGHSQNKVYFITKKALGRPPHASNARAARAPTRSLALSCALARSRAHGSVTRVSVVSDTRPTHIDTHARTTHYLSPNAARTRTQADANLCPKPPGVSLRCISSW